jgi:hypothetical protein
MRPRGGLRGDFPSLFALFEGGFFARAKKPGTAFTSVAQPHAKREGPPGRDHLRFSLCSTPLVCRSFSDSVPVPTGLRWRPLRTSARERDWICEDNPVRAVDVFVEQLDLAELKFGGADPEATGRPSYHPAVLLKLYVMSSIMRRRNGLMAWPDLANQASFVRQPLKVPVVLSPEEVASLLEAASSWFRALSPRAPPRRWTAPPRSDKPCRAKTAAPVSDGT